jgi:hypothetical protein
MVLWSFYKYYTWEAGGRKKEWHCTLPSFFQEFGHQMKAIYHVIGFNHPGTSGALGGFHSFLFILKPFYAAGLQSSTWEPRLQVWNGCALNLHYCRSSPQRLLQSF